LRLKLHNLLEKCYGSSWQCSKDD